MNVCFQIARKALVDTWDIVIGQPISSIIIALFVFVIAITIARQWRGKDYARDWLNDALIGVCAIVVVGIVVLLLETFLVPINMISEAQMKLESMTNTVFSLEADKSNLDNQRSVLQTTVDKDDAALRAVGAVTGYTNGTFAQNAELILSKVNQMQIELKSLDDRIFAPKRAETFSLSQTNVVTILLTTNRGPEVFLRLKYPPIPESISGIFQGPNNSQTPLILNGFRENVLWFQFPNLDGLDGAKFVITYSVDAKDTNIIHKVSTNENEIYFDSIPQRMVNPIDE